MLQQMQQAQQAAPAPPTPAAPPAHHPSPELSSQLAVAVPQGGSLGPPPLPLPGLWQGSLWCSGLPSQHSVGGQWGGHIGRPAPSS